MNIRKRLSETGQDKCPYCRSANIRVTFLAFFEKDRNLMGDETIQSVHCCSCGRPIPETTNHIAGVVSFMDVLSEGRAMGVSLLRRQALAALAIADRHLTPESSEYVRKSVIRTAIAEELESKLGPADASHLPVETRRELVQRAVEAYGESASRYWDGENPVSDPRGGDTLAEFIVREVFETFDEAHPVESALQVLERAKEDIIRVLDALWRGDAKV